MICSVFWNSELDLESHQLEDTCRVAICLFNRGGNDKGNHCWGRKPLTNKLHKYIVSLLIRSVNWNITALDLLRVFFIFHLSKISTLLVFQFTFQWICSHKTKSLNIYTGREQMQIYAAAQNTGCSNICSLVLSYFTVCTGWSQDKGQSSCPRVRVMVEMLANEASKQNRLTTFNPDRKAQSSLLFYFFLIYFLTLSFSVNTFHLHTAYRFYAVLSWSLSSHFFILDSVSPTLHTIPALRINQRSDFHSKELLKR